MIINKYGGLKIREGLGAPPVPHPDKRTRTQQYNRLPRAEADKSHFIMS